MTVPRVSLPGRGYDRGARIRFADALIERLRAQPGVADVAIGSD